MTVMQMPRRSRSPAVTLATRLARAACDLDHVVDQIAATPDLSEPDAWLLAPAATHLELVHDRLSDLMLSLERYGRAEPPWLPLAPWQKVAA
jgi:hypothetical protein